MAGQPINEKAHSLSRAPSGLARGLEMLNLSDEWWFLGQAVHWVAWRDDQFAGLGLMPGSGDSDADEVKDRLTLLSREWETAEAALFQALVDKRLVAYGINSQGRRASIDAEIWANAESGNALAPCIVSYGSEAGGDLGATVEQGHEVWHDVHLKREDLVALWPRSGAENADLGRHLPDNCDSEIRRKLSEAGKSSGRSRKAKRPWTAHAKELAQTIVIELPHLGRGAIASKISERWKIDTEIEPNHETLTNFVKELEEEGGILTREQRMKGLGNEQVQPVC